MKEVVAAAQRVLERPIPAVMSPRRAGDPATLVASIDRAKTILDWTPSRNLDQMISDTAQSLGLA